MKKFMAVFIGTEKAMSDWNTLSDAEKRSREQKGMQAWGEWAEKNQASIVDLGAPLGKTKRVGRDGISDIRNQLSVYTIVQAESHEAAAKIFLEHPHFTIFPGDSIEVMECLKIPGM